MSDSFGDPFVILKGGAELLGDGGFDDIVEVFGIGADDVDGGALRGDDVGVGDGFRAHEVGDGVAAVDVDRGCLSGALNSDGVGVDDFDL